LRSYLRPRPIGGSKLVRDYLGEAPSALQFFGGSPFRVDSFRIKLADIRDRFGRAERERAAAALQPVSAAARARLERFVAEGGAMVTTGQQAGFLTGPLYTVYKALSAIVLARHLEEQLGVTVLPVFWAATEDHDWAEANHSYHLDPRGRIRRFELPERSDSRSLPMSEIRLGEGVEKICDEVVQYVGVEKYTGDFVRRIIEAYSVPEETVGGAFVEAIRRLLGGWDLMIADAADPALKEASRAPIRMALTAAAEHEEALKARSSDLLDAGYGTQVAVLDRGVNLFLHGEMGRERLYRRGADFRVRERVGVLEREAVLDLLERDPGRLSPNVLLRPVIESAVFPTLAYVGGPGEINYFAQVTGLFTAFGIRPPVIVPRFSGVVVDPTAERLLTKLRLQERDLEEPREELRDRLARREIPQEVGEALKEVRADWSSGFARLLERASAVDPTLLGALGGVRNRGLLEAARAEKKILRALKRRELVPFTQLDRVLETVRPMGQPQDRILGIISFLARHGEGFLAEAERVVRSHWRLPE
jgi:bacillithiol synthase